MNEQDLSDKEREQHEQVWQDLDEKVLLAQILTELQQIRLLLSDAESGAQSDGDEQDAYRCRKCDATVPAADRERHARSQHKAPFDMVDGLFTEVEG